jgi:hypothetical protein
VSDERHGIPVEFAVLCSASRGGSHANEGYEGENEGQEGDVENLPFYTDAGVAGEVGLALLAFMFSYHIFTLSLEKDEGV